MHLPTVCIYNPEFKKKRTAWHFMYKIKKKREKNTCVQQLYTLPGEKRVKWFQYFFFWGGGVDEQEEGKKKKKSDRRS